MIGTCFFFVRLCLSLHDRMVARYPIMSWPSTSGHPGDALRTSQTVHSPTGWPAVAGHDNLFLFSSFDLRQRPCEQIYGARVEHVAGFLRRAAGAGAGVGAFEDGAELVAGEDFVPISMRDVAAGLLRVTLYDFGVGGKARPGPVHGTGLCPVFRPG